MIGDCNCDNRNARARSGCSRKGVRHCPRCGTAGSRRAHAGDFPACAPRSARGTLDRDGARCPPVPRPGIKRLPGGLASRWPQGPGLRSPRSGACRSRWCRVKRVRGRRRSGAGSLLLRAGASRSCDAKHPHNTHKLSLARIEYPHHPFCGTEVEVVRTLRRTGQAIDVVLLPDGMQIAVPCWMLDPITCSQLSHEPRPRVALGALLRLAEIAQGGRLSMDAGTPGCETSTSTKGQNVSSKTSSISPSPAAVCQEVALGSLPRSHSGSMPQGVDRITASSRHGRHRGNQQP